MQNFEEKLSKATARDSREILGAIVGVVDGDGKTLYHHAGGYQTLASNAPTLDPNSTYSLASSGKFFQHVAALQLVEKGLITLDEPVYKHLPELEKLQVLSKTKDSDPLAPLFSLKPATKKITLRHLLNHSSGIGQEFHPLIKEWRELQQFASDIPAPDEHPNNITFDEEKGWRYGAGEQFTTPLVFEPGEGWWYGSSLKWVNLLIARLANMRWVDYIKKHILEPVGMTSTAYGVHQYPDLEARLLQTVVRDGNGLVPLGEPVMDLASSMPDMLAILADLLSSNSKLLKKESLDLVFSPQFAPGSPASKGMRIDIANYCAPAGVPKDMKEAPVNHSLIAMVIEENMPLSNMPPGTVTWSGYPNVMWAMNKEKGVGMMFAIQLRPEDDEKTVDLAMRFFRDAWATFGSA